MFLFLLLLLFIILLLLHQLLVLPTVLFVYDFALLITIATPVGFGH
jgi:hypothetical protein